MERIEGLSIGLDLDSIGLERGLTGLKDKIRTVNSEMRNNMSSFDRSDRSVSKYETRLEGLNKKLEVQKSVTKAAKDEMEKMIDENGKGSAEAEKAEREYNNQAAALNNLERYVERTTDELEQLRREQELNESKLVQFGDKAAVFGEKIGAVGDVMKDVGKNMMMYVTAPLMGFGALATKTGIDFDDSMARVQAISGATGDDLTKLRDKAKEMGATTRFSASESAEALEYMALAGWQTEDMLGGIEGVMSLAAASGEDLATVSDIVTDALSAFGLSAEDSGRFADVLAAASANANTNVSGLGNAFKYVAPVAGALGYSVEDTATAIGLMSNAGIKGEKAGTALRTMMTNLAKPTDQMKTEMDRLGISLTDGEGNMKSFDEIMDDLRSSFSGLSEEQQASAAATIFGKEAMSGALSIVNASEEDYKKLAGAIEDSNGAAKEMSDIMEGTLGGTLREIKSGLEGFMISVYETMLPALEMGAEKLKGLVQWLNNLSPAAKVTGVIIGALAAALGPLVFGLGVFFTVIRSATRGFKDFARFIQPVISKVKNFGKATASGAKKGGLLTKMLRLILGGIRVLTGPVGWIISGVLALGTAFVTAYKKSETFREGVNKIIDGVKNAFAKVKEFIEGIKGLFHDDGQSGRDILASLGFSDKFIETVDFIALKLSHIRGLVTNFVDGIKGLFKDDGQEGRDLLSSIGVSDKMIAVLDGIALKIVLFRDIVKKAFGATVDFVKNAWSGLTSWFSSTGESMVEKATSIFGSIKTAVSTGIQTAVDFVKNLWGGLINWWNQNGDSILAKATSIFNSVRDNVSLAISTVVGYVKSVWSSLTDFWNEHGEMISQAAQNVWSFIQSFVLGTANIIWSGIKGFATGIYTVIKWALDNIMAGWAVVWPYIRDIATGVINAISSAVQFVFPYIVTIIKGAMNVISNIMSYVWPVVKFIVIETWNAIKGTIDGALKVITGLIQFFSALFTGNWSALWDAVKQILGGAVQFIWNFVQVSFFGRIIKGGVIFIKGFAGLFTTMWGGIRSLFSTVITWIVGFVRSSFSGMRNTVGSITETIRNVITTIWNGIWSFFSKIISTIVTFIRNRFTAMRETINSITTKIKELISLLWNNIYTFFQTIIRNIVDFVRTRFTTMRDNVSNIFTTIRDTAQRLWNAVKDKIWNPVKNVVKNVRDRFTTLKDNVSGIFSNMRDNVSEWVGKMVQSVKDMPGKMKDGLVQMAYKVKDGVKDLGQKMMDGIGGGVNGVIGGVNWVLGKLQVPKDKQLVEWDVPQLAHGTKSHKGGLALINDGKGDNSGPELIINRDGTTGMYEGRNVLANIAKGAQVIPAKMTRQLLDSGIPAYAKGIFGSAWDDIKSGVTWTSDKISTGYNYAKDTTIAAGKKIGEWTGNVWDYVENPGKLLNIALEKVGVSIPDGVGAMIEMAKGAFTTVKDKAIDFVKEKLNMGGPEGVSGGMGLVGAAGNWRSQIQRAAAQMGETVSPTEINGILAQINRESGGNQRIIQSSAVWDVNTAAGNPARGLLQYIPQTFNAYKVKGHENIYSGYDQLLAFFNNKTWRRDLPYGKRGWGPRGGRKYGTGGLVNEGLYHLGEEGYPEWIIPTAPNRRTEAMKLLALAGKEIQGNKRPHQLPNVSGVGDSAGIQYLESMVSLLSQQVDDLKQIILLLTQLVAKNPNLQIGEHEFKTYISQLADRGLNDIGNKKKTAWGGA
ncbi:phage tail tape measure protein [Oceanobacillus sp. FSL K6-0251]|uniref:phage tail tape measure protein n=1 Tax=Oceanobacillus sp. FSL K6-0251 TaxID=2921602 RepID=UPI0030F5E738